MQEFSVHIIFYLNLAFVNKIENYLNKSLHIVLDLGFLLSDNPRHLSNG